jgi:membrane protein YdbS with pleckstrin-like domain
VSARPVPPRRLWWLLAGFGVWCSALVFLYAVHAIGCAFAWPAGALRLALALVLLVHLIVISWMWHDHRAASADPSLDSTGTFLHTVIVWTLIAALVTVVLTLGPTLALATCV